MTLNKTIQSVTNKIIARSAKSRQHYCQKMQETSISAVVNRSKISCTNLAHVTAAASKHDKHILLELQKPNIAIVSAYNDMLSAHQPYQFYPDLLKTMINQYQATAQVAAGVPAMCDGITQGQDGMELSLLSRDVIAMSTAIGLSHNSFDGILCLGICDKIVPGLLIGALQFAYLPCLFIPSGPMSSGISSQQKAHNRTLFASGKINKKDLLKSETEAYHSPGTCVFYGTANSNQMLMEVMGLHLPGAAFVAPYQNLNYNHIDTSCERHLYNKLAAQQIVANTKQGGNYTPLSEIVTEKSLVNAIVMLIATGGSTNHTIHIPAIAKAAGITITWQDFAEISAITPLLAKIYPNGPHDINDFHHHGGVAYIIEQLLTAGLLHNDVKTVVGTGLEQYAKQAKINNKTSLKLHWQSPVNSNSQILRPVTSPFSDRGGLIVIKTKNNLWGQGIAKTSALTAEQLYVKAPIKIFYEQHEVITAYKTGELHTNVIIVLLYQGPKFRGMPELHGLMPLFKDIQNQGYKIALVTDGRLSGASGSIPAVIHLCPEASVQNNLSKLKDGDIMTVDLVKAVLTVELDLELLKTRTPYQHNINRDSCGRSLFKKLQTSTMTEAEEGASILL